MAEETLLGFVEQRIAPVDGGAHRAVPWLVAVGPREQVVRGVVEAAAQLGQAPPAHLTGGQLDGERQPVEAGAELDDLVIGRIPRRARFEPASAFDEQLCGREGAQWFDGHEVLVDEPERFPARRQHVAGAVHAEHGIDQLRGRVDHVLAVVEHDQQRTIGEVGAELVAGS